MVFRISSLAEKLSRTVPVQSPPGETETAAAEMEKAPSASVQNDSAGKISSEKINFKDPATYTLKVEGGYGWRSFQNEEGLDHGGMTLRAGGGLRFNLGTRLSLSPRLFYEFQGLKKARMQGVASRANVHAVGVELDLGIAVLPKWLSIHPIFGIGASIYRSGNRAGSYGAEFNENPRLWPLRSAAARIDLGLQFCTWGDAFCLGARLVGDIGVNPELEYFDGASAPRMGLSPLGVSAGGGVDVLRIVQNVLKMKEPAKEFKDPKPEVPVE